MKRQWDTVLFPKVISTDDLVSPRSLFCSLWFGGAETDGIFMADPAWLRKRTNLRGSDSQFVYSLAVLQGKLIYLYEHTSTIYGVIVAAGRKGRSKLPAPPASVQEESGYRYDADISSRALSLSLSYSYLEEVGDKRSVGEETSSTRSTSSKRSHTSSNHINIFSKDHAKPEDELEPSCREHARRWLFRMVESCQQAGMRTKPDTLVKKFVPAIIEMANSDPGAFRRAVDSMLMDVEPWERVAKDKTTKHLARWLSRSMSWDKTPQVRRELMWEPLPDKEKEEIKNAAMAFLKSMGGDK